MDYSLDYSSVTPLNKLRFLAREYNENKASEDSFIHDIDRLSYDQLVVTLWIRGVDTKDLGLDSKYDPLIRPYAPPETEPGEKQEDFGLENSPVWIGLNHPNALRRFIVENVSGYILGSSGDFDIGWQRFISDDIPATRAQLNNTIKDNGNDPYMIIAIACLIQDVGGYYGQDLYDFAGRYIK